MPSWQMIIKQEDVIFPQMKFLYLTEQRVIPETFRRFLRRIIRSLSVILSIRFMWIPTLWLEGPALMMQIHRCGVT